MYLSMSYHGTFWHKGPAQYHEVSNACFQLVARTRQLRWCGHLWVGSDWANRCSDRPGTCYSSTTTWQEGVRGHTGTHSAEVRHSRCSHFPLWLRGRGRSLCWRGDSGWPTSRAEHHHHRILWGRARGLVRPNSPARHRGKRQTCQSRTHVLRRERGRGCIN